MNWQENLEWLECQFLLILWFRPLFLEIDKNSAVEILELRLALDVGFVKLCAEKKR